MILIRGGVLCDGTRADVLVRDGRIVLIDEDISTGHGDSSPTPLSVIDASGLIVAPGLVDMHVHFREPGFEYKEDIMSGSLAAAAGGVTSCCFMANTLPVLDNADVLNSLSDRVGRASVNCLPIGAVTLGQQGEELTDFAALKAAGAVALSDDGVPIRDSSIMELALRAAKELDLLIISHCEDEAEMAERDVRLAEKVGARVHIAHVSLADTVDIIRRGKARGVRVTSETCPHYFSLTSDEVARQGALACMNPPLAAARDVSAVIEGLCDGTIDAIATDHAPHSIEEKALPPGEAPNGIIGLETSLGVSLTFLYHAGYLGLSDIIRLMSHAPARILGLEESKGTVLVLSAENKRTVPLLSPTADIVVFDPSEPWVVQPDEFRSKARNTPFGGMPLKGRVKLTMVRGEVVYGCL